MSPKYFLVQLTIIVYNGSFKNFFSYIDPKNKKCKYIKSYNFLLRNIFINFLKSLYDILIIKMLQAIFFKFLVK